MKKSLKFSSKEKTLESRIMKVTAVAGSRARSSWNRVSSLFHQQEVLYLRRSPRRTCINHSVQSQALWLKCQSMKSKKSGVRSNIVQEHRRTQHLDKVLARKCSMKACCHSTLKWQKPILSSHKFTEYKIKESTSGMWPLWRRSQLNLNIIPSAPTNKYRGLEHKVQWVFHRSLSPKTALILSSRVKSLSLGVNSR